MAIHFDVIIRELDGKLRFVAATADQRIIENEVIWDSRTQGPIPEQLLADARLDDLNRKKSIDDLAKEKELTISQKLENLKLHGSKEVKDLIEILGL